MTNKKLLLTLILVFSAVVHSAPPILVDLETGKYLDKLSANQHDQNSVNNPFGQHRSQHLQDSMNRRNSPIARHGNQYIQDSMNRRNSPVRYNAVIVKLGNPFVGKGKLYLQDSINKRNNPGGKYYERIKQDKIDDSNVTDRHWTAVVIPLYSW